MSASETRSVTVENEQGLHMRPAQLFAETAAKFASEVQVRKGDEQIDGKSILSLMSLVAPKGTRLELTAIGPDAGEAVEALAHLFGSNFAEQDNSAPQPDSIG